MRVSIYFTQFLKDDGESIGGGGIGTQLSYLCPLLEELGHTTTVYQCAIHAFETRSNGTTVLGIPVRPGPGMPNERVVRHFRHIALKRGGTNERIEIFAADFFSAANRNPLAIVIQQGLAWDAPIDLVTQNKLYHTRIGERLYRMRCQLRGLKRFETCYNRVAADLYFINWYRSFRGSRFIGRLWYNPNPAPVSEWSVKRERIVDHEKPLRIIFARRFVPEKGTRLIREVFKELLQLRPNLRIYIAGEGRDRGVFHRAFSEDRRVVITSYRPEDALQVHQNHDIAVIPSLCGEATCLAVLEAMSAGCAVVATNMGGMITQIIHEFNGMLCWPTKKAILHSLIRLIDHPEERLRIQKCGWESAQKSFGLAAWRKRWVDIIEEVVTGKEEAAKAMSR